MIIAVGNDGQFRSFCEVLGLKEFADDPRFHSNGERNKNRAVLIPALVERTRGWKKAELLATLEQVGVPVGPIHDLAEVFADPQVQHRKMRIDLQEGAEGGVRIPGVRSPIRMSATPLRYDHPSPRLGEHTEEVRAALSAGRPAFGSAKR
jgi:crotonobetainyl-CoA:carnitine CoA-transferase CaiB-like acyl-CoA transferase